MPIIDGKEYPYTKQGRLTARKAKMAATSRRRHKVNGKKKKK